MLATVRELRGPVAPERESALDFAGCFVADVGKHRRRVIVERQREIMTLTLSYGELRRCVRTGEREADVRSKMHHDRILLAADTVSAITQIRPRSPVIRPRRELDLHGNTARDAFDAAENLPKWRQPAMLLLLAHHRHEIQQRHHS